MDETKNALLCQWLEQCDFRNVRDVEELMAAIALEIAAIESRLVEVIRKVIACPKFRKLEASFRNIHQLLTTSSTDHAMLRDRPTLRKVSVYVLDISARELREDLGGNSHRQSETYDKLFRKRFDLLIGNQTFEIEGYSAIYPFSLVIVDFDFCYPRLSNADTQIGLSALQRLARIGEECFCMFLLSLAPQFFGDGIRSFGDLENVLDVKTILQQAKYQNWRLFRNHEDSRMIGLSLPRVLVRKPYKNFQFKRSGMFFNEHDGFPQLADDYLWGSSAFAVVQPIIRSFQKSDWFYDVCGVDRESEEFSPSDEIPDPGYDGGLIDTLPILSFATDTASVAPYTPVELTLSENDESDYSALGFIPLFSIHQSPFVATLSSQSLESVRDMTSSAATNNLRLSSMFNYMLCVCRMAHRLKLECKSLIGSSSSAEELQDHMHGWLMNHTSGRNRGVEQKMLKPFLDEQTGFAVEEDMIDPGRYDCQIRLCPHHKFDSGRTRLEFEPVSMNLQLNSENE